jgi:hypothetical protein
MDQMHQITLPLFEPISFAEILCMRKIDRLIILVSARMKRGWYVKINAHSDARTLKIPSYLEDAPAEIKDALIDWALLPNPRTKQQKKSITDLKIPLEKKIQGYITTHHSARLQITFDPCKIANNTTGVKYDLQEIFDAINCQYFDNELHAYLRWGKGASTTSYQTTRTLKDNSKCNLITIAGVYDHPEVPRFALEAVMYHEMLHIKIPPYKLNGKNIIQGREFKSAELNFQFYKEWRIWEREHLRAIARKLRKKST